MPTNLPDLFASLAAPFEPHEVKVRSQAGRQLHYITARTAMNRLDNVLGPENWWDEYVPGQESVLCRLTVRLPDGTTITKADAGGYAGMADSGDDDKSGFSDAFKRAAVKFGVARYLYNDGVPGFAREHAPASTTPPPRATSPAPTQKTSPPAGPGRTPSAATQAPQSSQAQQAPQQGRGGYDNFSRLPPPDKWNAVFAWAKSMEEAFQVAVVPKMGDFAESIGCQKNFKSWSPAAAEHICKLTAKWLTTLDSYQGQFDGKIDLSGVSLEAEEQKAAVLAGLRNEIIATIKRAHSARHGGEPTRTQVRSMLDTVSSLAVNGSGHRGDVVESLANCTDELWLHNMLKVADQLLAESGGAPPDQEGYGELQAADSEIPF